MLILIVIVIIIIMIIIIILILIFNQGTHLVKVVFSGTLKINKIYYYNLNTENKQKKKILKHNKVILNYTCTTCINANISLYELLLR